MNTKLLTANDVDEAAEILKNGGIAAIPTETVYGLAANALDARAVEKIFKAKGRPSDNPLIVHIAEPEQLCDLVCNIPESAVKLMSAFWPGALTLVLNASARVPAIVTAGLPTVAVRCPSHPAARAILRAAGVPLAAPSANRSGLPSPTRAKHVLDDMDGRIDAVVDGGDCGIGVESTVLDMTVDPPCVLRYGGVQKPELERCLGVTFPSSTEARGGKARSPGQKYRHYAPGAPLTLLNEPDIAQACHVTQGTLVICPEEYAHMFEAPVVCGRLSEPETLARGLFAALREADARKPCAIAAVYPVGEEFAAVRDRLKRAAGTDM